MKNQIGKALVEAIREAGIPEPQQAPSDLVELSKDPKFGDWSSPVAFSLAKSVRKSPRDVAREIVESGRLAEKTGAKEVSIDGAGFINIHLHPVQWQDELLRAWERGDTFGRSDALKGKRFLVEFVSANPTGPLHVGHGRNAAIGDALVRLLRAAGAEVSAEYYVNDVGGQIETLVASVLGSLGLSSNVERRTSNVPGPAQAMSHEPPETCNVKPDTFLYSGPYINGLAKALEGDPAMAKHLEAYRSGSLVWASLVASIGPYLVGEMLTAIRTDLSDFRVRFDSWSHEGELQAKGMVRDAIERLRKADLAYDQDGAVWFRSSRFGDEKDRVLIRENSMPTYFASDIAYHLLKADKGWEALIDVWGADHHGYIPRVRAALEAMGHDPNLLDVVLVQMVSLVRGGQRVEMSKRKGTYVTLREVLDEVGADVARFFFLMRESNRHLDFDMDLAKSQSEQNPVYYVQYAHARVASLFKHAASRATSRRQEAETVPEATRMVDPANEQRATSSESRFTVHGSRFTEIDLSAISSTEEIDLIKWTTHFPWVVAGAARAREPHRLVFYLIDLVKKFHHYYNLQRIVTDDREATQARLVLCEVFGRVVRNGLDLVGASAPERM